MTTPAAPLRARALAAMAAGGVMTAALAFAMRPWIGASPLQPLVATAVFAGMMAAAFASMGQGHPFARVGSANLVTMLRGSVAALSAGLLFEIPGETAGWALAGGTAMFAALDGADGALARRSAMKSDFGARFDMETDAFFLLVLSVLVWRHGKADWWVLGIGLMRYAFVACGRLVPWLTRPLRSTVRGKTVAVLQMAVLGFAVAPIVPPHISNRAAGAALAALAWSFAIDVRYLWISSRPR